MRRPLAESLGGAKTFMRSAPAIVSAFFGSLFTLPQLALAAASDVVGYAVPGQVGLQPGVTPIAVEIHHFHDLILLPIITVICLFVLALLVYIVVKFNSTANPTPSRMTHNAGLEVAWTVVPVLILVIIAIPSFRLLTNQLVIPGADVTVKVTGHQWYWSYAYPKDNQGGGFGFSSYMTPEAELKQNDLRLLAVDNEAVVPVNKVVTVQVTSDDVIHSFVIPAFGIRIDAVPGRLNQTWFKAEREGIYYGQCSKLCGKDHSFMPIAFRVVSDEQYAQWLNDARKKFAGSADPTVTVAGNAALEQ
jgi:cytochrome c oxidase subunit II